MPRNNPTRTINIFYRGQVNASVRVRVISQKNVPSGLLRLFLLMNALTNDAGGF